MDIATLLAAVSSPDDATRNAAEAALSNAESTNPGAYFLALAQELKNDARDDALRQQAGLLMKVSLDSQNEPLPHGARRARWLSLDENTRKVIKGMITESLGAVTPLARKAAAQVIAKVGFIEIAPGDNKWPELLAGLFGVISRVELPEGARASALTALGYLLEELDAYDVAPFSQLEVDQALTTICSCIVTPAGGAPPMPTIQSAAMSALFNTLSYVAANFEDDRAAERDSIMMAICTATSSSVIEVRQVAFSAIERIAELYYDHLESYMRVLADLTAGAARGADEIAAVNALGFWAEIATTESQRDMDGGSAPNKHYIVAALGPLVPILTDIMCKVKEEAEESDFGPAESAQATMKAVSAAAGPQLLTALQPFISANFASPQWQFRDAAVMCVALIQEGDSEALKHFNKDAFAHVLGRFTAGGAARDPHHVVRSSAAFCASEVLSYHVQIAKDVQGGIRGLVSLFVAALSDVPFVSKFVCRAIHNLILGASEADENSMGFYSADDKSCVLSPDFFAIINALIVRGDKEDADENDLRTDCYLAISTIVDASREADEPMLLGLLQSIALTRIRAGITAAVPIAHADLEKRLAPLLGMVSSICIKAQAAVEPQAPAVAELMLRCIDAHIEPGVAWSVICELAMSIIPSASAFAPYFNEVHPRLIAALRNVSDASTCRSCIFTAASVISVMGDTLPAEKRGEYINALLTILRDNSASRDLKPPAIATFGDFKRGAEPFLHIVLPIIADAAALPDPEDAEDEDFLEYLLELRKACLDMWTNVTQAYACEEDEGGAPVSDAVRSASKQRARAVLGHASHGPLVDTVARTLGAWAAKWRSEFATQMAADPAQPDRSCPTDLELVTKAVGLIADLVQTLGLQEAVAPAFMPHQVNVLWLIEACHTWEMEEQDIAADETIGNLARARLGLPRLAGAAF